MVSTDLIQDFIAFLNDSPTSWHAVDQLRNKLSQSNFLELSETQKWKIHPQSRYFVTRNGSSLAAFVTPKNLPKTVRLLASHTDSPGFKLKPQPEILKQQSLLLGVEIYGSPLLTSWFNRDLGIAGRIAYTDQKGYVKESLVRLEHHPVIIPQLAIHLDREVNEKGIQLNKQEHLNALAALGSAYNAKKPFLESLLSEEVEFSKLISHDLFLFPLEKARLIGYQSSFISSYRIDSLASVHAATTALLENPEPLDNEIKMIVFWDNEEVGSHTSQGADSPFFSQILERIITSFNGTREDYFCLLNLSTCVSIDLAHALHPSYSEKHDPQHQPILGKGVVIKHNAQQRYATHALSSIPIQLIASRQNIPLQSFVSRNDMPCGTTIGPLQASLTGMPTVDLGCGQLSMHSCRELISSQDHIDMCHLLKSLFHASHWPRINN